MRTFIVLAFMSMVMLGCVANTSQQNTTNQHMNQTDSSSGNKPVQVPQIQANQTNKTNLSLNITRQINGSVLTTDTVFPAQPHYDFRNTTTPDGRLIVYFFYSPHCSACQAIIPVIDNLETKFSSVEWLEYDITTQNGTLAYQEYAREKNLSQKQEYIPQVLVNGTIITDRFNINDTLGSLLENISAS
jgi:thiol-disulfide isomerase/thioredoxin